jgi:hypothetical protein
MTDERFGEILARSGNYRQIHVPTDREFDEIMERLKRFPDPALTYQRIQRDINFSILALVIPFCVTSFSWGFTQNFD